MEDYRPVSREAMDKIRAECGVAGRIVFLIPPDVDIVVGDSHIHNRIHEDIVHIRFCDGKKELDPGFDMHEHAARKLHKALGANRVVADDRRHRFLEE